MATTYAEAKMALDEIARIISQQRKAHLRLLSEAAQSEALLSGMQQQYQKIMADINANALTHPLDGSYQYQKAEKENLVQEFVALRNQATSVKDAIDGALNG